MTNRIRIIPSTVSSLCGDWCVRNGIKTGLSAVLCWFLALWIPIAEPVWGLFTVFVLSTAPYVGGLAEKSALRVIGTLTGGVLGTLLVGNFAENAAIVLGGTFLIVGFCTYKFGGNRFPYAYLLCGLTALVVIGDSLDTPQDSWQIALTRFLEISLGVFCSMLVGSLLWPRYARKEFVEKFREALDVLLRLVEADFSEPKRASSAAHASEVERDFAGKLNRLRLLLHFGACENPWIRRRLALYGRMLDALNGLFLTALALGRESVEDSGLYALLRTEVREIRTALLAEFRAIVAADHVSQWRPSPALAEAFARFETKLQGMRKAGRTREYPTADLVLFVGHCQGLFELRRQLEEIHDASSSLEHPPKDSIRQARLYAAAAPIDPACIRNGIKSGLAAATGLLILDWLQPPGGPMIPLAAWVIVALSRTFALTSGDLNAFRDAFFTALVGIGYVLLLLVLTPVMASYAAFNVLLFACLFVFGYHAAKLEGITFLMQVAMFGIVSAAALNPQMPVDFRSIEDAYFGVVISFFIGALIRRLIWPVLPQREMAAALTAFFDGCRRMLQVRDKDASARQAAALEVCIGTAAAWAGHLRSRLCPADEQARLRSFFTACASMANLLRITTYLRFDPVVADFLHTIDPAVKTQRAELDALFLELRRGFANGGRNAFEPPPFRENLLPPLDAARKSGVYLEMDFHSTFRFFGFVARARRVQVRAHDCAEVFRTLNVRRYLGDYSI